MIGTKRVLAIVPVRGGSKGVPDKNLRPVAGRPLLEYTLDCALACPEIDRLIVSTDSPRLADIARVAGVEVPFMRPSELAGDGAGTIDVLLHAMDFVERVEGAPYDIVLLLHATCPLRAPADVRACLELVVDSGATSAFTVASAGGNPYFNMVELDSSGEPHLCKSSSAVARQSVPQAYVINGAAYAWPWDVLREERGVILPGSRVVIMPRERSVDVDDEFDLRLAELLLLHPQPGDRTATEGR